MKTTDVYYLMNDTMYVSDKGLCDGIKSAKQFSSYEDAIIEQIKKVYAQDVSERYDIMNYLNTKDSKKDSSAKCP